jgi:hypothetical protein
MGGRKNGVWIELRKDKERNGEQNKKWAKLDKEALKSKSLFGRGKPIILQWTFIIYKIQTRYLVRELQPRNNKVINAGYNLAKSS